MRRRVSIRTGLARALCVLALLFLGLAHQPPLRAGTDPALAYALPDGTIADLCSTGSDDGKVKLPGKTCEACRLAASLLPPPPAGHLLALTLPVILADLPLQHAAPGLSLRRGGQGPRAPPALA